MADRADRERLEKLAIAVSELNRRDIRREHAGPGGLLKFIKHFWHVLEPQTPLVDGWVLAAICLHLEAVTDGRIKRLLMNVPPGSMKSLIVNVFWPAWEWGPKEMAHMRYVSFSYGAWLTERDNARFRDLMQSKKYIDTYARDGFKLTEAGKVKVANSKTGWKFASSQGGVGTGERGTRILLDDPHNVADGESDIVRRETVRWFREAMSNRLNDYNKDAIVIIMQRVHEEDVSGVIIENGMPYEILWIPMKYDPGRHCSTSIGWSDPRTMEGELAWPERFSQETVDNLEVTLGPFAFAGQYQQSPEPRGGGIFKREWWNPINVPPGTPLKLTFQYVIASLDTAYTTKEENDPSAMTVWGVFEDSKGQPKILLMHAWEKRLEIHGARVERIIGEKNADYIKRAQPDWGLVEWVIHTCRRFKVDRLIIESKAAGHSTAQEVRRLTSADEWAVELKDPKGEGDKTARAYAVQHLFTEGMICAPAEIDENDNVFWRSFVEMVISQAARFPKGHDDLVDTMTQALRHLRQIGLAVRREERQMMDAQDLKYPERSGPLYPS